MSECVFCQKFDNEPPDVQVISFEPLNPVTPGHLLVVPRKHVENFTTSPEITALVAQTAALIAKKYTDVNLITSKGSEATQTIKHLHFHIVPRTKNDGLKLPWTDQIKEPNHIKAGEKDE